MTTLNEHGIHDCCGVKNIIPDPEHIHTIATWDETFMGIAVLVSKRSKDPSTQVGAVIVSSDNKILGVGYNGMPIGDDTFPWSRPEKYQYVIHAEENALLNTGRNLPDVKGGRLYCNFYPCFKCARLIVQAGIKEVIFMYDGRHRDEDAERTLTQCGVKIRNFVLDNHSDIKAIKRATKDFFDRLKRAFM